MSKRLSRILKVLLWLFPLILSSAILVFTLRINTPNLPNLARISYDLEQKVHELSTLSGVLGAGIVIADTKLNERMMLTYRVNDEEAMWMFRRLAVTHGFKVPLFNAQGPNTHQMVDVLNGGSTCFPFKMTVMAAQMPSLIDKIKSACLFGMPYIDSRYRHYILFFTNMEMTLMDFEEHLSHIDQTKQILFLSWIQQ